MKNLNHFITPDDIFGNENIKIRTQQKLPMIEFEKNNVKFKFTNIWCFDKGTLVVLQDILNTVMNNQNTEKCAFKLCRNANDKEVSSTANLITAMWFEAKFPLIDGVTYHKIDAPFLCTGTLQINDIITFDLIRDHAKSIYEYSQRQKDAEIKIIDLVAAVAEDSKRNFVNS